MVGVMSIMEGSTSMQADKDIVVAKWNACKMITNIKACAEASKRFRERYGVATVDCELRDCWIEISRVRNRKFKNFKLQNYQQFMRKLSWDNKPLHEAEPVVRNPNRYY